MEVVGAIASFVAIGQALNSLPKIVDILRSIPESQRELMFLLNELETLRATHAKIEEILGEVPENGSDSQSFPISEIDALQLEASKTEVESLMSDLHCLCEKCIVRANGSSEPRVKRRNWFWKRAKAKQLLERAQGIRTKLQLVMADISLNRSQLINHHSNIVVKLEIHHISYPSTERHLGEARNAIQPATLDSIHRHEGHPPNVPGTQPETRPLLSNTTDTYHDRPWSDSQPCHVSPLNVLASEPSDTDEDEAFSFMASLPGQCLTACPCQCHHTNMRNSPSWLTSFLGSVMVSYNAIPIIGSTTCDILECKRSNSSLNLTYRFPRWLYQCHVSVKVSLDSVTGYGATLHASIPRPLPSTDMAWYHIAHKDRIESSLRFFSHRVYLPTDEVHLGVSLLQVALLESAPEVLSLLLAFWKPLLRKNGITREVVFAANAILARVDCHCEVCKLAQDVLKFNKEPPYNTNTSTHRAIIDGDLAGVLKSVIENPTAINSIDHTGRPPLHWAIIQGNTNALQLLIRSGVDTNMPGLWGRTALHIAVANGDVGAVKILVDAGCAVDRPDFSGNLPIHLLGYKDKMTTDDREILKILLQKCPSLATRKGSNGMVPMMCLAARDMDLDVSESVLFVLLNAGAFPGSPQDSASLISLALQRKMPVERLCMLVEAGAPLDMVDRNILVSAAMCADLDIIEYLRTQDIKADTEPESSYRPWTSLRWTMTCDKIDLRPCRQPSREEAHCFALLLCEVRDKNLRREINMLNSVLEPLQSRDGQEARHRLAPLLQWKRAWNQQEQAETYRTLGLQIKEEMWDAAIETIEENIDNCLEVIGSSPWEIKSVYDKYPDAEDYAGVREQFELVLSNKGCPLRNPNWRQLKRRFRVGRFRNDSRNPRVVRLRRSNGLRRCWEVSGAIVVPRWL
ncbi:hypothetical protein QBC44DRAFT_314203 [Cladorrhinum sp. PSN332]|nr:hypothetical protein QBC44DRAFT_314203 [Cladorrhinum sp. PSN332]